VKQHSRHSVAAAVLVVSAVLAAAVISATALVGQTADRLQQHHLRPNRQVNHISKNGLPAIMNQYIDLLHDG